MAHCWVTGGGCLQVRGVQGGIFRVMPKLRVEGGRGKGRGRAFEAPGPRYSVGPRVRGEAEARDSRRSSTYAECGAQMEPVMGLPMWYLNTRGSYVRWIANQDLLYRAGSYTR